MADAAAQLLRAPHQRLCRWYRESLEIKQLP